MFENVEVFYRPTSVKDAMHLLERSKGPRIVAGCTDVAIQNDGSVRTLIDITRAGLSYIKRRGKGWAIGATTTMAEIEESAIVRALAGGLLSRAAATCGSVQIRNMATVGGNMANGSPAADLATPLLALEAKAVVADADGRRQMPLAEYLAAARSRAMAKTLLIEVTISELPVSSGWSFQKFGRTAVDISLVNVAAGLQTGAGRRVNRVRIALGSVAPTPIRMTAAEELMTGRVPDRALLDEVREAVMRDVRPISDSRASEDYRRELSGILTRRALEECMEHTEPLAGRQCACGAEAFRKEPGARSQRVKGEPTL